VPEYPTQVSDQVMTERHRAIVHLDLDAFFAAVEVLENPDLAGRPLIIGGHPKERGVVATASYPARAFGVHSAMPMSRALALCPDAIVLPARHSLYRDYSRQVMAVLHEACPTVEQVSIDEAYLDLSDQIVHWESSIESARQIQHRIHQEIRLSASLGVATNKLVAKVASDQNKPFGLTAVKPGDEAAFLDPLPVQALHGIGPVTARKLAELGVTTVGDLARIPQAILQEHFGHYATAMARMSRGIDERPVVTEHERKSISQETTFSRDVSDPESLRRHLWGLSQGVGRHLRGQGLAAKTVAVKVRYPDFSTLTRQMRLAMPIDDDREIYRTALVLFRRAWKQGRPVRLLGVAVRGLSSPAGQLWLWEKRGGKSA